MIAGCRSVILIVESEILLSRSSKSRNGQPVEVETAIDVNFALG